jgi:hypothetical protein
MRAEIVINLIKILQEEKRLSPPGSAFHGVWLKDEEVEQAKRERFSKELISFRNSYEKPIIDAFKEVLAFFPHIALFTLSSHFTIFSLSHTSLIIYEGGQSNRSGIHTTKI